MTMKGSKSKILFLDIDGVLNRTSFGVDTYTEFLPAHRSELVAQDVPLLQDNVENLKEIIDKVNDLGVVWSTDWRFEDNETYSPCNEQVWRNPRLWLESQSWFKDVLIGKTPKKLSSDRHEEIHFWLSENEFGKKNSSKKWFKTEHANHFLFMNDDWYDIEDFAILDDYDTKGMSLYGRRFFCTKNDAGLDRDIAKKVISMMNNDQDQYNRYNYKDVDWRKRK